MGLHPSEHGRVHLHYEVERSRDNWVLPEETVPESRPHDLTIDLLKALLAAWAARTGRKVQIGRNLAIRWDPARPSVGVDPDIYVLEPPPPEGDQIESLLLWTPGHHPPLLAVEVVSASNAVKDYAIAPEKHAACGTGELWIFDPKMAGPRSHGGPTRLQVWTRNEDGMFSRRYWGDGPAWSPALQAWLFVVEEGQRLRIADDEAGTAWWMTTEEASQAAEKEARIAEKKERAAKEAALAAMEAERIAKEAERVAKEAALARIAELEAQLARKG